MRTLTRHLISTTIAALITTITLPTSPSAQAANDCPAVEAIAVPGTSQTTPNADPRKPVGVLGTILEPLTKNAKITLATYYTPYPATIIGGTDGGGYRASKNAGIDATNARLGSVAKRCPKTMIILTGFSQGADIVGDIAATIGHNKGTIPATRILAVALLADPSQAPAGQPTIGLQRPGMGFAGVRTGGFGSLTPRNAILSVCAPQDYFCNLPQNDLVMRLIGHLGSHIDASDPAGSAQKLATIFMAGLIAPATAAINQILQLVNDPNLIPNLIQRGIAFAHALAQQLFSLAGPQVAAAATDLVNTATHIINLVASRSWTALPAMIATLATKATTVGTTLTQMRDKTATINTTGFAAVGQAINQPTPNTTHLAAAVLNAISVATGGIGTQATGVFGPTFSQFTTASVAASLRRFAQFLTGGFHDAYATTPLDRDGHTGTQIIQRYLLNHVTKLR